MKALNIIAIVAILLFTMAAAAYWVLTSSDGMLVGSEEKSKKLTKIFGWIAIGSLSLALLANIIALFL